jgi:hypothetical protein
MTGAQPFVLTLDGIQALLDMLKSRGYRVLGPTVRNQAIVYDDIATVADLPRGWTDEQEAGRYRLKRREDDALFGFSVGPHSWKQFLHPPVQRLWRAERGPDGMRVITDAALHRATRVYRRAVLRTSCDRHSGQGFSRRRAPGSAMRRTPSAASTESVRSCMSSRVSTAIARKACRRASCGTRCMRSIAISVVKAPGWSITPSSTVPACVSEPRSPKVRRTSWSIGE